MTRAQPKPLTSHRHCRRGSRGRHSQECPVRHPHLDVHIYESAPEFSERVASLGISGISQKALTEMSPDLIDVLHDAGAVPQNSNRFVVLSGGQLEIFTANLRLIFASRDQVRASARRFLIWSLRNKH
jgi:hypothetical protein